MEVYKFTGFGVVILLILDLTVLALKLPQLQGQNTELGTISLHTSLKMSCIHFSNCVKENFRQ